MENPKQSLRDVKRQVRALVELDDFDAVDDLVRRDKRALSALVALSYNRLSELSWRAVHMAGRVIGRLAGVDHESARVQTRKIIWNMTDESGTIPWTAPELLGEAIRENPKHFEDIVPLLIGYSHSETEDNIFMPGVLYAIWRIFERHPRYIGDEARAVVLEELGNGKNSERCANAVVAAGKLGLKIPPETMSELTGRTDAAAVYLDGRLESLTIGQWAAKMLGGGGVRRRGRRRGGRGEAIGWGESGLSFP